jgi:hypothetical protein
MLLRIAYRIGLFLVILLAIGICCDNVTMRLEIGL